MSTLSSNDFKKQLEASIEALESESSVELVVVVYPRSSVYRDIDVWLGLFSSFAATLYFFSVLPFMARF